MRHVRDVIRLKAAGMPTREIARRVGAAPSTVRLTIRRFEASGLTWPMSDDITDTELEARLFAGAGAGAGTRRGQRRMAEPDWASVHRELKRKHVTLSILWEEYIAGEPGGYRYSRFCELYRAWEGKLSVTMRQSHAAGDKLFVDYAGDGVPVVIDRLTGERRTTLSIKCQATVYQRSSGEEDRRRLLAERLTRRCCRMKATEGGLRLPSAAEIPRSGRSRQLRSEGLCENVECADRLQHHFRLPVFERLVQVWMTMRNDRALWQLLNDALSSANERSISVSTRIRPTISRARFFDGSCDGRNSRRSGDEGAESRPYPFN